MKKHRKEKKAKHASLEVTAAEMSVPTCGPIQFKRDRTLVWLMSFALVVGTCAIYSAVRRYGFGSLDDSLYITNNPNVLAGWTWQSVWWAFTTDLAGYWVPLTWLSHIIDAQLFGYNAGPQHVINVLLHLLNTLLLFSILRRTTKELWQSFLVAGLFAVHPLHVESVAWIAERKDVLSTMFALFSVSAYINYVRDRSLKHYIVTAALFALALLSKPSVVTLPFVFLLLDFWPLARVRLECGQIRVWRKLALEKVPLLGLAVVASVLTLSFHSSKNGLTSLSQIPLGIRLGNAIFSYVAYLRDTLWPANLAAFYPYEPVSAWQVGGAGLILVTVTVLVLYRAKKNPYLCFGWFWYLGTLFPMIGIVQAGMQARADRFTYLALTGVFIAVVWGIADAAGRWRYHRETFAIAGVLAIAAFTVAAHRQVGYWQSRSTLWEHALDSSADSHIARNVLGLSLMEQGKIDEAIINYRKALEFYPAYADTHNNLAIALARLGNLNEAEAEFREAIRLGNPRSDSFRNLGLALARQGRYEEALEQYSEALRMDPKDVASVTNSGDVLVQQGNVQEAVLRYSEALRIQPRFALAQNNLAFALASLRRYDEAILHYREALRIQPKMPEALNGLGVAFAQQGRYDDAAAQLTELLRINPNYPGARENLNQILSLQYSHGDSGGGLTTK